MKKTISLLLALLILLSMTACSKSDGQQPSAEIKEPTTASDLVALGYRQGVSSCVSDMMYMEFYNADRTSFYIINVPMNNAQYNEYDSLDWSADDYTEQVAAYLDTLGTITFTDLTEHIPSVEEYQQYVGKTMADLEADGWWQGSVDNAEDGSVRFAYGNDEIMIGVILEGDYKELFSLPEDYTSLPIKSISFYEFNDPFVFVDF